MPQVASTVVNVIAHELSAPSSDSEESSAVLGCIDDQCHGFLNIQC